MYCVSLVAWTAADDVTLCGIMHAVAAATLARRFYVASALGVLLRPLQLWAVFAL